MKEAFACVVVLAVGMMVGKAMQLQPMPTVESRPEIRYVIPLGCTVTKDSK